MDLSGDAGQPFALVDTGAGVTLRDGDPTLKDIVWQRRPDRLPGHLRAGHQQCEVRTM